MAADKQKVITDILKCLTLGKSYSDIVAEIGGKWQISQRTFDRRWKEAKEVHSKNQEAARMAIADKSVQADIKAIEGGLIDRAGRLRLLSDMANGLPKTIVDKDGNERKVYPSFKDQQAAIDMLTRMNENYSPINREMDADENTDYVIQIKRRDGTNRN